MAHPHEEWQKANFGCYHVSNGRRLPVHTGARHLADLAEPLPHDQQEDRLKAFVDKEPARRRDHAAFDPAENMVRGARAYNHRNGMADPHMKPYHDVATHTGIIRDVGRAYGALPDHDKGALPHFHAMREEVGRQFDHLTGSPQHGGMGVHVESVDYDPYKDVHEMVHDLRHNNRIKVLGTHVTGEHPFFSNEDNDRFRAVHDAFGHAATGRGFDAHGEHAAFAAHSAMFSQHARPAMTSETLGQNAFLHLNGDFGPQKIALLPHQLQRPTLRETQQYSHPGHAASRQVQGADWGEYRWARDAQDRRYERAGVGGGKEERDAYYGRGEHRGRGQEQRVTPQDWMRMSRQPTFDDLPRHEQEWNRGFDLGEDHGRNAEHADFTEMDRAHQHSTDPDHFYDGYVQGLNSSLEHAATRLAVRHRLPPRLTEGDKLRVLASQIAISMPNIVRLAHDSGDGMTIFHCFGGETRYWTQDGIKTLGETVGTTQKVLSNTGNGGTWVDAEIHEFGVQSLMKVTLRRNKRTKVVYATPEHRWLVRNRTDRSENRVVATQDLRPEQRLAWLLPRTAIARSTPSPFGIAHGVVYGDGTRAARGSVVNLWGEKDTQLLRYFAESRQEPIKTEQCVDGVRVLDLPAFFKARPGLEESVPYLYGWLAGYFAADGTVSKQGQVLMHSASRDDLEFFQLVAMRLGIGSYDIMEREREGFGEQRPLFQLQLIGSTLRPEFFLIREHRERYGSVQSRGNAERIGWTVDSVEETDRAETVYCAVVPEHENFVLDGLINTMNCPFCGSGQVIARSDGSVMCDFCQSSFNVTIQPQYPAFPQTINGVPVDVPGMGPTWGDPAGNAVDPEQVPDEEDDGDGESGNPFAGGGDDEEDSAGPPENLSKTTFRTASGARLSHEHYLQYLALQYAPDPGTTLRRVRSRNARGTQ